MESNLIYSEAELFPFIFEGDNFFVPARVLHEKLAVETRFNDWIDRRIKEYGFIKDFDYYYSNLSSNKEIANIRDNTKLDYNLSIDMAKELAMVEKNANGRKVRRYFIEMEKIAREFISLTLKTIVDLDIMTKNGKQVHYYSEVCSSLDFNSAGSNNKRMHNNPEHIFNYEEDNRVYITVEFTKSLAVSRWLQMIRKMVRPAKPLPPTNEKEVANG